MPAGQNDWATCIRPSPGGLLGLIGLHVAAALYHAVILRDDSLRRMW